MTDRQLPSFPPSAPDRLSTLAHHGSHKNEAGPPAQRSIIPSTIFRAPPTCAQHCCLPRTKNSQVLLEKSRQKPTRCPWSHAHSTAESPHESPRAAYLTPAFSCRGGETLVYNLPSLPRLVNLPCSKHDTIQHTKRQLKTRPSALTTVFSQLQVSAKATTSKTTTHSGPKNLMIQHIHEPNFLCAG